MRLLFALLAAGLAAAQQVPPSIVSEGVPEVPKELVRKLNPYSNIRSAGFASWHPTRREILISTRFADTPQIHRVKTPGGAREQITFFREPVGGARYSPQGKEWFVFGMDEGGAEFYQLYRYDLAAGDYQMLTDGKSRNGGGPFSRRGDRVAYTSTRRNGRDTDVWVMDPEHPESAKMVYEAKGQWSPQSWSPDDRKLLLSNYISINESYLHVLDVETGKTEPLLPPGTEKVAYGDAEFSRDGKGVYLTTDAGSEFQRLCYLDLATKKLATLTAHIPWDVEGFDLSEDGTMIAFVANEDGISRPHLMRTGTHKELPPPKFPTGQISGGQFHKTQKEIAYTMVTAKSPADVYSYNWETGALTRWTFSEAGGLNAGAFPETQLVHYPSFDGRQIPAFVTRPPARFKAPYPVIINIHGGPEGQATPGLNASFTLNELGIATIHPNVRGSSGYGKTYLKLDNAEKREDSVKDIGALLDWIAKQPDLDAKRVAVMGGSYGGYMTLASVVHYSDRLRCGIDVVGISNWVTFLRNTQAYRQDLRRAEYGDERDPKMRDLLETISPLNHTEKIKVPLLVVQGTNDPRVPVTESLQMVKKIRDQGGSVWYIEGKDEGHGFRKKQNSDYQSWAQILFLQKYLLQ